MLPRRHFLIGASSMVILASRSAHADLTDGDFFDGIDDLLDLLGPIKDILDAGFTDLLKGIEINDPQAGQLLDLEKNYRAFLRDVGSLIGSINRGLEIFDLSFPEEVTERLGKHRRLFSTYRMRRLRKALQTAVATQEKVHQAGEARLQQVQLMRTANRASAGYPTIALNVANELNSLQLDAINDLTNTVNASHHAAIQEQARLNMEEKSALDFAERFMAPAESYLDSLEDSPTPPLSIFTRPTNGTE